MADAPYKYRKLRMIRFQSFRVSEHQWIDCKYTGRQVKAVFGFLVKY